MFSKTSKGNHYSFPETFKSFKMAKIFTKEEVKAHNKPDDLWIVIHNKGLFESYLSGGIVVENDFADMYDVVYNVSAYREEHPGGAEVLIELGGIDATEGFEDVGHSDDARELLEPLLIGELPANVGCLADKVYAGRPANIVTGGQ
jgi:cytochrome-b5 reductase